MSKLSRRSFIKSSVTGFSVLSAGGIWLPHAEAQMAPFAFFKKKGGVPLTITYRGSYTNTTSINPHTLSGCSIGTASADRMVVVCAGSTGAFQDIGSVTVGGINLSLVSSRSNTNTAWIWAGLVTSGTTANVVVTHSSSTAFCSFQVYTIKLETAPTTATSTYGIARTSATTGWATGANLDIPTGGVGVACIASGISGGPATWTWSNATEGGESDFTTNGGTTSAYRTTAGTTSISATPSIAVTGALTSAAWGYA